MIMNCFDFGEYANNMKTPLICTTCEHYSKRGMKFPSGPILATDHCKMHKMDLYDLATGKSIQVTSDIEFLDLFD